MKKFIKCLLVIILVLGIMLIPSYTYAKDNQVTLKKYLELDENGRIKKIYSSVNPELYIKENYTYNGLSADDAKFDQRYVSTNKNVVKVKDQGKSNSCWAFAGTSVIESYLSYKNNKTYDFSPQHIDYLSSRDFTDYTNNMAYDRDVNNGGSAFIYIPYFVNNVGPVSQSDVPFTTTYPKTSYYDLMSHDVLADVNSGNIAVFEGYSADAVKYVKKQIVKTGAVTVGVRAPESTSESYIYNASGAWYDNTTNKSNHEVTLVGWDDNYSASNFTNKPAGNGAWIMLNSWGESSGDKGYFYVSYYDNRVYETVATVSDIEQNLEDNTYSYASQYPTTGFGNSSNSYVANVYSTKNVGELITEITIGYLNVDASTNYKLFINKDSGDLTNITNNKIAEGTIQLSEYTGFGYYTIHLNEPIEITGEKFAVAVQYNGFAPVTVNTPNSAFSYSSIGTGKVFLSTDANKWIDLMSSSQMGEYADDLFIPIINVATNNPAKKDENSLNVGNPSLSYNNTNGYDKYIYTSIIQTNGTTQDLKVSILDSSSKDVTESFESVFTQNGDNYNLVISNTKDTIIGKYTVNVTYKDKKVSYEIVIYPDALVSEIYGIDQSKFYIYKVSLNTTYSNFKKNFKVYSASLYNGDALVSDDTYKLKTNNLVKGSTNTYKVAVNGDLNGDGICDGSDTVLLTEAIMEISKIDDIQKLAGDVNGDNKSNAVDILLMKRYIAGLKNSL